MTPPGRPSFFAAAGALLVIAALSSCAGEPRVASEASAPAPRGAPRVVPADAAALLAEIRRPGARATLVNVWATWCAPCVKEMPELLELERAYRDQGLRVMLVSADFDSAAPAAFLGKRGVTFDTWFKTGGDQEFIDTLEPRWSGALPVTIVYDAAGRARAFWEGSADYARFEQAVQAAMDPEGSPSTATGGTR